MSHVVAAIMKEAYESPAQLEADAAAFADLLGGRSLEVWLAAVLTEPVAATVASIEQWVTALVEREGPRVAGDRLHNLGGLLDLAWECSESEVNPNPFSQVAAELGELLAKYPRSKRLVATPPGS